MGFNFPNAPALNQVYLGYQWDGQKWKATTPPVAALPDASPDNTTYGRKNNAWSRAVALAGDTMTGSLVLNGDPSVALGAVTKQYVDAAVGATVTKAYVDAADALRAPIASPAFTGNPTAPTPTAGDNDTSIATTAFVQFQTGKYLPLAGGTVTGGLQVNGNVIFASGGMYLEGWQGQLGTGVLFFGSSGSNYLVYNGNWSFVGGSYVYAPNGRLWGTGDFSSVPVSNARLAYAGDFDISATGMNEPYGGAVVTGVSLYGLYPQYRFRYMQLYTTSWFTVGYA